MTKKMKPIREAAIYAVIQSLISGRANTLSLMEICIDEDSPPLDLIEETRAEADLMERQIKQLTAWLTSK
jgi:hypothetical protein